MSSKSKTGLMNIRPGKISYRILEWMQSVEGTNALKNTTGHIIAGKICALPDVENGELTIEQTFSKMVKCNVVYRDQHYKSIYSDYRINYWHKSIPADILANAPVEVKREMAKTIDDMQPNQYMDDEGCVVTPNSVEKSEDPFNEDAEVVNVGETSDGDVYEVPVTVEDTAPQFEEPTTQNVTVPLDIKKDGKQISVTLNLTINL